MMKRLFMTLCIFLLCAVNLPAFAQPNSTDEARNRLRILLQQEDYVTGRREGHIMLQRFPKDAELQALYVVHLLRIPFEPTRDRAVAIADSMVSVAPDNAWSWYSLAMVLPDGRYDEALSASNKASEMLPGHPDMIQCHADVLARKNLQDAITYVDRHLDQVENPAALLGIKADAQYRLAGGDKTKQAIAFETFRKARGADATYVPAYSKPGQYLMRSGNPKEAYPLLALTLELSPRHASAFQMLLQAIQMGGISDEDQRQQAVVKHIDQFATYGKDNAYLVYFASAMAGQFGLSKKQAQYGKQVLAMAPDGPWAEWVMVERYRNAYMAYIQVKEGDKKSKKDDVVTQIRDFLNRPQHHNAELKGDAYRSLYNVIHNDPEATPELLLETVQGMAKYETINPHIAFSAGAITLAERTTFYREAEQIARDGIPAVERKMTQQKAFFKSPEDYEKNVNALTSKMYEALGWVYFKEGRITDAERELSHAYTLKQNDRDILFHLGQIFEAKQDNQQAESFYQKGLQVKMPGENPCEAALKTLYEKTRGNMDGYDAYLSNLNETDSSQRKKSVLAERLADPKAYQPFELDQLDGNKFSSDRLAGKIAIINFWGIWCGPCVMEMPDIQQLYEKYKNDPDVILLTINNDRNRDKVPAWMTDNEYTFPVLYDEGYVQRAGIQAFPTTWFINPEGQILYIKVAWTKDLLEEFSWRIEALRQ